MPAHGFSLGEEVRNGRFRATVKRLISDDALAVLYDGDDEETIEVAQYFQRLDDRRD